MPGVNIIKNPHVAFLAMQAVQSPDILREHAASRNRHGQKKRIEPNREHIRSSGKQHAKQLDFLRFRRPEIDFGRIRTLFSRNPVFKLLNFRDPLRPTLLQTFMNQQQPV